jgi:hypothetical protein
VSIFPSSFRDPSGFLFWRDGILYRQINAIYKADYDRLMSSGLYRNLVDATLLVPHQEIDVAAPKPELVYKVIRPDAIPFVSYAYEWCFSQLKDAALTTLRIQREALEFGMSLKDCSAYNIQFRDCKPTLIDTLSFERYREGQPWVAYRQFCQHFLAPLALMALRDVRLSQLSRIYIDGIPLDLAASLLPRRTWFRPLLLVHLQIHAAAQKRVGQKPPPKRQYKLSRAGLLGILNSLEGAVRNLRWKPVGTEWQDYYADTNYSQDAFQHKKEIVVQFLDRLNPKTVWDIGANVGVFSRLASAKGAQTVSIDADAAAVEKNYLECVANGETKVLPLLADLTNPSSGIGWQNSERMSLQERGPAEAVLALALVHHLAIANNVPFAKIAEFLKDICASLIIEFIPKSDSQVQRMLATREDIFGQYTQAEFEIEFERYFAIEGCINIKDSERSVYLMRKRGP